jgi:hypothetical protein
MAMHDRMMRCDDEVLMMMLMMMRTHDDTGNDGNP